MQFSLRAYSSANDLIISMAVLSPSTVLDIRPVNQAVRLLGSVTKHIAALIPGRSTRERSITSGPLISKDTEFLENSSSDVASSPRRNSFWSQFGLRIANWARLTRSATSAGSCIGSPNCSSLTSMLWPCLSVKHRIFTIHFQGDEVLRERRHSVGQLSCTCQ